MIQVASSFSTDPSLDVVLSSIPAQIYEAIHLLKESMDSFTAKVSVLLSHPSNPYSTFLYLKNSYFMHRPLFSVNKISHLTMCVWIAALLLVLQKCAGLKYIVG